MKEIPLTRGLVAHVDDEDYEFLMQWRWCASVVGNVRYAVRTECLAGGARRQISMHSLILERRDGYEADHKNRNGLDNRRENLRYATRSQNMQNRSIRRRVSAYRGVKKQTSGRFQARIQLNGAQQGLGTFDTAEEAARVYDTKAKELHGEFAVLNFPD